MIAWPDLRMGTRSPDAGNWQRFLIQQGYRDDDGHEIVADEAFGPRTAFATKAWQRTHGLLESGVVSMVERGFAQTDGYLPFLQARNYTPLNVIPGHVPMRAIDVIVFHDMEYPELPKGAEWCASFFAGPGALKASAHYCVDFLSVIQCVRDRDVAWHAPGANHNGIGIEHAGYARQTREEWLDEYSRAELAVSAKLVAQLCALYTIPILKLSSVDLKAGARGICGHRDVTDAFSDGKGHQDPGLSFPYYEYLEMVRQATA